VFTIGHDQIEATGLMGFRASKVNGRNVIGTKHVRITDL
jgi:hypothetical protein